MGCCSWKEAALASSGEILQGQSPTTLNYPLSKISLCLPPPFLFLSSFLWPMIRVCPLDISFFLFPFCLCLFLCLFLRQGLTLKLWLIWSLLCRPGGPGPSWAQSASASPPCLVFCLAIPFCNVYFWPVLGTWGSQKQGDKALTCLFLT